ncbi:MAG TPA: hypothetical protein VNA14_01185 [Mycobacteriales bacterium]|nr:hypothetical protein [Mycobacteriales bacterium]
MVAVAMVAGCSDGAERFEPISLQFRPVTGQSPAPCASSSANSDPAPDPNSAIEVADERLCFTLGPSMLSPIRVRDAAASEDPTTGVWFLDVALTEADARTFADVTRTQRGEQLAVVVDGEVISAPSIHSPIPDGEFQLHGDFTEAEAKDVARRLNG